MKRYRTALILLVVLLGLGGLATWDEWQTKRDAKEKAQADKLIDVNPEQVTEIDYATTEGAAPFTARLVKKDGAWRLVSPVNAKADDEAVHSLLDTFKDYKYEKVVADSKDHWAEYGLDKPVRSLTFVSGTAKKTSVYLGNKAPVGYSVYTRTDKSDKVYVGSQHILMATNKTLNDLRDKSLAQIDEGKIKTLEYEAAGKAPIELVKEKGTYRIIKPESLAADDDAVKDFISELNRAKVQDFKDNPPAEFTTAFAKPTYIVTWTAESGAATKLTFANTKDGLWAAYDPSKVAFKLADELKPKLAKSVMDFRNRRIFAFNSGDVQSVDIDGDVYKRVKGDWYTAAEAPVVQSGKPSKGQALPKPASFIESLVLDLQYAKADAYLKPTDPAVKALGEAPLHSVVIGFDPATKKAPVTINAWAAKDGKFFLRLGDANVIDEVPAAVLANIKPATKTTSEATSTPTKTGSAPL